MTAGTAPRPDAPALALALALALAAPGAALAAEGAASHYLPGAAGDFGLAIPPKPGAQAANVVWIQSGDVDAAPLQGRVEAGLDVTAVLDLAVLTYTWADALFGASYTAGVIVPFGHVGLEGTATGPLGNTVRQSQNAFNLSDITFVPLQLNWGAGDFSFEIAETIFAPSGAYDTDRFVNLGRNHWSFDTGLAATWFHADTGTEVSLAPGIMVNTENRATDYRTGVEFHLDVTANQFLSPTFALGLRGYWYRQLTGDSGSGALLGDFKSDAVGIGPGFLWLPAFAGGWLAIAGTWIHDLDATNRFASDYGLVTVGWKF